MNGSQVGEEQERPVRRLLQVVEVAGNVGHGEGARECVSLSGFRQ